jgi:hypothetical protein
MSPRRGQLVFAQAQHSSSVGIIARSVLIGRAEMHEVAGPHGEISAPQPLRQRRVPVVCVLVPSRRTARRDAGRPDTLILTVALEVSEAFVALYVKLSVSV